MRGRPIRFRGFIPVLALGSLLLSACDLLTGPRNDMPEPLISLPRELTVGEQQVIAGSNALAFGLLRETMRQNTAANVFLSPLSASMALGMSMNGARGATLSEMQGTLGFGSVSLDVADQSYRTLIDLLRGLDSGVDMRLANSIWARKGFPFEQSFYDTMRRYFDAQVTALDFNSPQAAPTINEWVKQSTGGKIDQIVNDPIDPSLVMFLINAVYFKGSWRNRFDPAETADAPFTTAAGGGETVKMMHGRSEGSYFADADSVTGVELPYGRGAYGMDVVLPPPGTPLADFVAGLDTARWNGWLGALHDADVDLSLPRFRLDYGVLLNGPLQQLGMRLAFTDQADFSGLSRAAGLLISTVKQKTYVNVNEEGTEAAAATSVGTGVTSVPQVVSFVVNRPFLVAIRERFSGTILFLGAIGAPESE